MIYLRYFIDYAKFSILETKEWNLGDVIGFMVGNFEEIFKALEFDDKRLLTMIHEIRWVRNRWAHQKDITLKDLLRFIDSIRISLDILGVAKNGVFYQNTDKIYQEIIQRILFIQNDQQQHCL